MEHIPITSLARQVHGFTKHWKFFRPWQNEYLCPTETAMYYANIMYERLQWQPIYN